MLKGPPAPLNSTFPIAYSLATTGQIPFMYAVSLGKFF